MIINNTLSVQPSTAVRTLLGGCGHKAGAYPGRTPGHSRDRDTHTHSDGTIQHAREPHTHLERGREPESLEKAHADSGPGRSPFPVLSALYQKDTELNNLDEALQCDRAQYHPQLQGLTGGLTTYPPQVRGGSCSPLLGFTE